ncbi:hypothetical protein N431DRAFT_541573 [Stipitochalara longipes BDJ]|nr:hypothetical protein N431DRAFT_541573 [Stipitochalara longipes BDJ]
MPTSHPTSDVSSSQPLLHDQPTTHHPISNGTRSPSSSRRSRLKLVYNGCKTQVSDFLSSRAQHWTVLGLVSFDLLGIFADIIINLYQCDEKDTSPVWDDVRNGLGIGGLVFSCLFMLELILSVWAFGWRYFNSWFHSFDAAVIVAGFIVDVLLHGILEEVASLVIILRLWRFFKIIEEFSVGAEEQMDGLELRIEQLETENEDLKRELKKQKGTLDEEEGGEFTQNASGSWK